MRLTTPKKAALVVAASLALCAAVVLPGCGGGGSSAPNGDSVESEVESVHSSAENIADEVSSSFEDVIDNGFSADSIVDWTDSLIDLMPEEAIDAALEQSGMSRSEFSEKLGDTFGSTGIDQLGALLDYIDMEITFEVGDELSSSELDDINTTFSEDVEADIEATSGYHLSMDMTMTVLEDVGGAEAGETESQTQDESGIYVIEIDDSWYVWMG